MRTMAAVALVLAMLPQQPPGPPPPPGSPPPPGVPGAVNPFAPRPTSDNAMIRGRVIRGDGRPLPRAQVRLERLDVPMRPLPVATDEDGVYEIGDLPAGRFRVTAMKTGFIATAFGQRQLTEPGEPIAVRASEVREHVDITLDRASAVLGRIVDENGEPVEGAIVRVLQIRYVGGRPQLAEAQGAYSRRTNDLGQFRLFGVLPGRYLISAAIGQVTPRVAADLPGYAVTYFPGTPNPSEAQFVTVNRSQDAANINFALSRTRTASIRGTALSASGDPILGGISLVPSRRSGAIFPDAVGARIARDGTFEFPNVASGEYVVQVQKGRSQPSVEGEFASQIVTVNGTDVDNLVLQTSTGSQVSGRFTFEGGDPPRPGGIELSPVASDPDLAPRSGTASAEIHPDWTFEIGGLTGPRRLRLVRAPRGWMLKAILLNGTDITDAPLAFGTSEQSLRDLDVVLTSRLTTIAGGVADSGGTPVPRAHVIVYARDRDLWYPTSRFVVHGTAGADGTFTIRGVPPAAYFVVALERLQGNDSDGEWQNPALLDTLAARARSITVAEGQQLQLSLRVSAR